MLATETYSKSDAVSTGSGCEISIKELTKKTFELTEYKGKITWDATKPNGQPRWYLDTTKAQREFGFKAKIDLKEGSKRTVDCYRINGRLTVE